MFPAGKQFPELQELTISTYSELAAGPVHITTAELRNVISACPAITSLDMTCALQSEADMHAMLQFPTTCRRLEVGGEAFGDDAAVVIAQLTQLTGLLRQDSPGLTDGGLDWLTALHSLEKLKLQYMHGLSDGLAYKVDGMMHEEFSLTAGDQPVWQQLHDRIRSVPCNATWSRRLDSLAQLEEQQATTAKLQLDALSSYIDHAQAVIMFCVGSAEVMQAARSMVDLGCKTLSGTAVDAGVSGAAGAGSGADGVAGLGQQYRKLQEPVKQFCSNSQEVMDALSCMEAAVLQAVDGAV